MSGQRNPVVWILWLVATTILIASTRNPLYLVIAGITTSAVYLSVRNPSTAGGAWATVLRIGLIVAAMTIAFNVLTVHAGDRVLYRLPEAIPIFGGPATWNALSYGTTSAGAILILMLAAAAFSHAVDRADLLRAMPAPVSSAGIAAIVGLSFFPRMLAALRDVREAQAARGFRVRSVRDLPPLVVPVLHLGLERAFDLAETIESRGFGSGPRVKPFARACFLVGLTLAATGVASFGLGFGAPGIGLVLAGLGCVMVGLVHSGGARRGSYRPAVWSTGDLLLCGTSVASILAIVATFAMRAEQLVWSPYPELLWPSFGLLPGLASLGLIAPAVVAAGRR